MGGISLVCGAAGTMYAAATYHALLCAAGSSRSSTCTTTSLDERACAGRTPICRRQSSDAWTAVEGIRDRWRAGSQGRMERGASVAAEVVYEWDRAAHVA